MSTESATNMSSIDVIQIDSSTLSNAGLPDTTTIFNGGKAMKHPVPGHPDMQYVAWGDDNQLPYELASLIGEDEVTSQNKLFNVLTCYGQGLALMDDETHEPATDPAITAFHRRQLGPTFLLEQITDLKYYYMSVSVIILSRDGKKINRIIHKEACHCRLEPLDKQGRINHVFYGDWKDGQPAEVEVIPCLDLNDPVGDLMQRMGREPLPSGLKRSKPVPDRKFAIVSRFPTVGNLYYPVPHYASIFRGGSYEEKRLISLGKRAKLKNATSVKYQVEIYRDYYDRICREEGINDPVKMQARVNKEKQTIREYCTGLNNTDKVWISQYYINPDGKEQHDVVIKRIGTEKEGGDWNEDIQAASNTICYGDNVHPNLVGATPGKSQMNNSGSDKRELFTMKQTLETAWHHILLSPVELVCEYNGWNVHPEMPIIMLTTLDSHTDGKEVSIDPNEPNKKKP